MKKSENTLNRSTAVLILLGIITLLVAIAVSPFIYNQKLSVLLAEQQDTTDQIKSASARLIETLKQQKATLKQYGQQEKFLLSGETVGLAGADLQKRISASIRRYKGKVSSYQLQEPEKEQNLVRISMTVNLSANISNIQKILHELETGTPFIFIEDMVIQAQDNRNIANTNFQRKTLDVVVKVTAYFSDKNTRKPVS